MTLKSEKFEVSSILHHWINVCRLMFFNMNSWEIFYCILIFRKICRASKNLCFITSTARTDPLRSLPNTTKNTV